LRKVGLESTWERKPHELSGGQQQRVGIARALVTNPELMLWDEPTASLDPILVGEVLEVMEDLVKNTGTTMIIVTHEVSFALRVAQRIVFMDKGQIVEAGAPQEVLENPRSEIAQLYKKLLAS
ncbi:MAG: amino acid ABC transporter ATP-binding protein, partial [Firmicutes bacterium]|nr:amino acid ABC transporter ATP-binding protein [Bacillota bacterium]